MRRFVLLAGLALATSAAMPAASPGAVTIGSRLLPEPNSSPTCPAGCTHAQFSLDAARQAPGGLVSPIDGVVVRWRAKADGAVTLRIVHPLGLPGQFTGGGTSVAVLAIPTVARTFTARLAIQAGDRVGLDGLGTTVGYDKDLGNPGNVVHRWDPRLANSGAPRSPDAVPTDMELPLNADIEVDCDGDVRGDETLDPLLGKARRGACLPRPRCAGKKATHVGTTVSDVMKGTAKRDVFAAAGGNDRIKGLGGNDIACGGKGNDILRGGDGNDKLLGQAGRDVLKGGPGTDTLNGGKGRDTAKQ